MRLPRLTSSHLAPYSTFFTLLLLLLHLLDLLLLVIPWQEKIWVRCCHRALVSRQPGGACQEPLQNEGAGHSSHFALHKNQDWLNLVDVRRLTVSRKHFLSLLMLYDLNQGSSLQLILINKLKEDWKLTGRLED